MVYNFVACDRDQHFLMPPSLNEWLPIGGRTKTLRPLGELVDLALPTRRFTPTNLFWALFGVVTNVSAVHAAPRTPLGFPVARELAMKRVAE